ALDTHHAARARCVHELATAERDAHVRRPLAHGLEEDEIAWPDLVIIDLLTDDELLASLTRKRRAVLREHPLDQTAAIESLRGLASAVAVLRAFERERS